jgi:branched-chain amino acid transport system permease protein
MDGSVVENLLQRLLTGILVGSIYGLLCAGLGMIFGVIRVINFAQGEFMMLGMYTTLFVGAAIAAALGIGAAGGAYGGMIVAAVLLAAVGWVLQRYVITHVSGSRVSESEDGGHFAQLILTLGLSLVISNMGLILFGSSPRTVQSPLAASSWTIGPFGSDAIMIFVNQARAIGCVGALVVSFGLYLFVQKTRAGTSMRAAADNSTAATIVGINVEKCYASAFAIGIGATAFAGGLIAMYYPFHPYIGFEFVIIMYAGVVLGGMGSMLGAFWGGFTIGIVQQLSTYFLPFQLQNATIFILFLAVVLLRPQGLFGRSAERT